jgi:hypothetical protein
VIIAQGELSGGYVFYIKDRKLVFDFNDLGTHMITSEDDVPDGPATVRFAFKRTAPNEGSGTLFIDDRKVGGGRFSTQASRLLSWEGLDVGRDGLSPVSPVYADRGDFAFTKGALQKVVVGVEKANIGRGTPGKTAGGEH